MAGLSGRQLVILVSRFKTVAVLGTLIWFSLGKVSESINQLLFLYIKTGKSMGGRTIVRGVSSTDKVSATAPER